MAKNTVQSVEPNIADLVNGWLKSYKVDYKLEQESLNTEIDQALNDYFSKNGGKGGNRPDAKLLLQANDGKYYPILIEYKGYKDDEKFPADAFILNPPYSAEGNGMIFVEKALSMMDKGYAAIIIQNSAGSGNAVEYNKSILTHSTLLASVRMPIDLFVGKSSVQTHIYVFRIGEAHQKDDIVKFIDFSNDGYTRSARKKSTNNLRDTDNAKERYQELVNLVRFGKSKMSIFTEQDYYEGVIDPENGADWNQTSPIDTKPTVEDFKKTVSDYLAWEVSTLLKNQPSENERLGK